MLPANKQKWFERIFAVYNRNLIWRNFSAWRVANFEFFEQRDRQIPLLVYANHSSWWDGLFAFQLCWEAKADIYAMMEEKNLLEHKFHRKLGAFSVIRENPRDAVKSINYAAEILREKENRLVWIFPQGKISPNDTRPIGFFNGLSRIVEKVGRIETVPLAFRYEFLGEYKAEMLTKIGKSEIIEVDKNFNAKRQTEIFAENLTETLDEIGKDILANDFNKYRTLIGK